MNVDVEGTLQGGLHEAAAASNFINEQPSIQFRAGITDGIHLDRLEEICNAERDGRCVVLLCKVGDTVWDRHGMAWEITQVELHMNGRTWFRCGHKGTDDYTAFSDEYIGDGFFLTEPEGKAAKEQWEKRAAAIHAGATLEEAEAVLGRRKSK